MAIAVPYGSSGWSYLAGGPGHSSGFQDPAYDVSGWAVGSLAMGIPGCGPLSLGTVWNSNHNSDLCLRKTIGLGLQTARINARIDDNIAIWVNGVLVFDNNGTISGAYNISPVNLDDSVLNAEGANVFAFRVRDRQAVCAWVDIEITAEEIVTISGWRVGQIALAPAQGV